MPSLGPGLTRREFISATGRVALAAVAWPAVVTGAAGQAGSGPPSILEVYTCRTVVVGRIVRSRRVREMIDGCVTGLSGQSDIRSAWRHYVRPGQKILLKFTRFPGRGLGTEGAMLKCLLGSLEAAGHNLADIIVVDCPQSTGHTGLAATPVGWSRRRINLGGSAEQVRRYLDGVEAIINVPSLTDHHLAGVACGMMNVGLPLIRNPARHSAPEKIHDVIVSVCSDRQVIPPVVLTIANALVGMYDGGPMVADGKVGYPQGVWASTDMVALDRLALEWIDRRRQQDGLERLQEEGRPARYLQLAVRKGLGQADLRRIRRRSHDI